MENSKEMKPMLTFTRTALLAVLFSSVRLASLCGMTVSTSSPDDFGYSLPPVENSVNNVPVGCTSIHFDVNNNGAAIFNIPITTPSGHCQVQPNVSICYNSQSGNGVVGYGCNISGLSAITRVPADIYHDGQAKGLTHLATDNYSIDGQRLMRKSGIQGTVNSTYNMESDPMSVVAVKSGTYGLYFSVSMADGRTITYGNSATSRQNYKGKTGLTICNAWYIDHIEDTQGNYADYTYLCDNNFVYISKITYGKNKNVATVQTANEIAFTYETRGDVQKFRLETVEGKMGLRLKSITTKMHGALLRKYTFTYNAISDQSSTKFSRLVSVIEENASGEQLKPTVINWNYLPSPSLTAKTPDLALQTSTFVHKKGQNFMAADMNGDGISDLIEMCPVIVGPTDQSGKLNNYCYIYPSKLNADGSISFSKKSEISLGASFSFDDWSEQQGAPVAADITGDGIVEIVIPSVSLISELGVRRAEFQFVCGDEYGGNRNMNSFICVMKKSNEFPVYTVADFDNDGKSEIVVVEREPVSGTTYNLIRIYHTSGYTLKHTESNITLPGKPKDLYSADFNNDGLNDVIFIYDNGYKLFLNRGDTYKFNDARVVTGTNLKASTRMGLGDFNGDGVADFIVFNGGVFSFALGQGDGSFSIVNIGKVSTITSHGKDDTRFGLSIFDFDHDGMSDVVVNAVQGKATTYWLRSTGTGLSVVKTATSNRQDDALSCRFTVGDFNGDGAAELLNYGYNCFGAVNANVDPSLHFYGNWSAAEGRVTFVADGFDNQTSITYGTLASSFGTYTRFKNEMYPMADITLPLPVVTRIVKTNGAVANEVLTYKYKGLKAHLQGKGLLGMSGIEANNETTGRKSATTLSSWDRKFFIPCSTTVTETTGDYTSTTVTTQTVVDKGNKVFFAYPKSKSITDFDGDKTLVTYQYDTDKCVLTEELTERDDGFAYKAVSYGSFVKKPCGWLPQIVDEFLMYGEDVDMSETRTIITYDNLGRKASVKEKAESSMPVTTYYTYDAWGNVLSTRTEGQGVEQVTMYNEYDAHGDNIVKKYTSPASAVNTFTYNSTGSLLTENDETDASAVLTVSYTYDGWGRLVKTVQPTGKVSTTSTGWGTSQAKKYYTLKQGDGEPWVKTWYDARGREVLVESVGAKDVPLSKQTTYGVNGLPAKIVTNTGVLSFTENLEYDTRDRLIRDENERRNTTTYSYGLRSTTTTKRVSSNADESDFTTNYDAWGNIASSVDPLNTVEWKYGPLGKPISASTCGNTVSMEYDDVGNRTSLTDPDAGTMTYEYDAAGRELRRTDARGKTIATAYDYLGRVTSVISDWETTKYTYGTSGSYAMRLQNCTNSVGTVGYVYDTFGRLQTELRYILSVPFLTAATYEYDKSGNIVKRGWSNLTVNYDYDSYGNMTAIKVGDETVWQLTKYTGRVTHYAWGKNLVAKELRSPATGYLKHKPVYRGTENVAYLSFDYNADTGNLGSRSGVGENTFYIDDFYYDQLDRLKTVKYSILNFKAIPAYNDDGSDDPKSEEAIGAIQPSNNVFPLLRYMTRFSNDGNILSKYNVGSYTYEADKPHAVTSVENTNGLIPENPQYVEYDAYGNVTLLEEGGSGGYRMEVAYGPDGKRWVSKLYRGGSLARTVVYGDDFEYVNENGTVRYFYYLGEDVLCVVDGKGDTKVYYMVTDNLGSIVNILDADGNAVFTASYDAWGRQTIGKNDIGFLRGYTGHEMLTEFNLVNMNGRLYDPALGRFLSPDNYVQMPENSQSFNRYSYCLNNPLKYTDPSGEYLIVDDLIAAFVGGVVNLGANLLTGDVHSIGQGASLFGVGALSGVVALYNPLAAAGIVGLGNSVVNQGFTNGWNNIDWGNVFTSGAMSVAMGYLGGAMSSYTSTYTSHLTSWIPNDIARKTFDSALSGSIVGFGFGSVLSLGQGNSFGQAFGDGLNDAAMGFTVGAIGGFGNAVIEQRQAKTMSILDALEPNNIDAEQIVKEVLSSSKTPLGSGDNSVYLGTDDNGIVRYVGITAREPSIRFSEHLHSKTNRATLRYHTIDRTGQLSRMQALIMEQRLINIYGLGKNGGLLYNKINSISPKYWEKYDLIK